MGLKIVIPIEYQRVKKISLKAMPRGGFQYSYDGKLSKGGKSIISELDSGAS
jgi:hypothetical protein